jgi:hypothetical protein
MWYPWSTWIQDPKIMQLKPIFEERSFSVNKRLVGVLIPFHEPFEALYEDHIKPFLENLDFKVQRADNKFEKWYSTNTLSSAALSSAALSSAPLSSADWERINASSTDSSADWERITASSTDSTVRPRSPPVRSIMDEVWILLNQSHFLIADVTGKNPNVFYEIGIAHTIGKYVIVISQKKDDVPFDIGHLRYIFYECDKEGIEGLLDDIKDRIELRLEEERRFRV